MFAFVDKVCHFWVTGMIPLPQIPVTWEMRAENDVVLCTYLETSPRNALYTSKIIQNEMIVVIGNVIEDHIIDEIQAAKFFTLLGDEATDYSNLEQVSIVIGQ